MFAAAIAAYSAYTLFLRPVFNCDEAYIYVARDTSFEDVSRQLSHWCTGKTKGFDLLCKYRGCKMPRGRYRFGRDDNMLSVYRRIRRGIQEPAVISIRPAQTVSVIEADLGRSLMIDSAEISAAIRDSAFMAREGFTTATLPSLFIPDNYEVYWNISANALRKRILKEYKAFWNKERRQKASALRLSPAEVATLASIVESETSCDEEKPIVAGLYLNRIARGMLLQADPTVKYAVGDPTLKRILYKHLEVDSPYNTYKYPGLPPGPIRIASRRALESVLSPARHNYLFMCAKEDFSGRHNFASTSREHSRNARRYQAELNRRKIR